ncbi:helicase-related protein [Candidatus Amarolinea aalborgensis]|uniref:helicase-related protein n=1 Tax=Candidatus Amarolinea aalborgensis TaxID=2249329 RepID=UPI003BF9967A
MPRIFDNIEHQLLSALQQTVELATHADFCVGYFNLRGWRKLAPLVEPWPGGQGHACRLLVGMQRLPEDELRSTLRLTDGAEAMDNQTALRLKKKLAEEFRRQLVIGAPTNQDEAALRRLAAQIRARKLTVKLFLRHPLHAKLYLLYRPDPINPIIGYLGSSNLTLAGLSKQGELNVDVLDPDAALKLSRWFEDRWTDRWCLDISDELAEIVEESWAAERLIPPYHIYVKMAYHLAQEARAGLSEFRIPADFGSRLFDFQTAAVKIAAHHLNKRGGVLIGDVVGLGKTLMATAVARIFEDDYSLETLIICPKNLVKMWEGYREQYRLRARVLSISRVLQELPDLRRYRLVVLDESHNLRNREGKRYRAIQEYIQKNESRCILLTATPYNKTYLDLGSQLRLFVPEDKNLGIRPERLLGEIGETEFIRRHQCSPRSLAGFEKSLYPDDWRELMRLYMVRRTRGFIQQNYAQTDAETGRKYLTFEDGTRSYFPVRQPRTVRFAIADDDPSDQYARLYAPVVVDTINSLRLPRYGLGNYAASRPSQPPTAVEKKSLDDLSRAGKRLMGFCRTNLFKRLESSGHVFIQSVERHILRNYIFLHAIEQGLPLPIGAQDAALLDSRVHDEDEDIGDVMDAFDYEGEAEGASSDIETAELRTEAQFRSRAAQVYAEYATLYKRRFKWLRPALFNAHLKRDLAADARALLDLMQRCAGADWAPARDAKLNALHRLLTVDHPRDKVLIFTQFADTVRYLEAQLRGRGVTALAGVTGDSPDPTGAAWRFSPESNEKRQQVRPADELRVVVATDVLSEGQNLQDAAIVVNYDLPWAIIRLIQRAGRVDRIGQRAEAIRCYSFLPADGVERIIRLRARVRQRLTENAEVVGTDEAFFEDDRNDQAIVDLYSERAGILDGDDEGEVDLASYAYQIWKNALAADPSLQRVVPALPAVAYSAKAALTPGPSPVATGEGSGGVLVYMRTGEGNDALVWVDRNGQGVTESQFAILQAAACAPDAPALPRDEAHHDLVKRGAELVLTEERSVGGQLGRPSGARFRTFTRLKGYAERIKGTFFDNPELLKAVDDIYRYPLRQAAADTLNRQLRAGVSDEDLAELVVALREDDRLCLVEDERQAQEPQIICSLGLIENQRQM